MHTIYITIIEENLRSIKYFEKFGFVQNGILKDMIFKDGKYQNYVWMSIQKQNYNSFDLNI
jgi:RimJ/RimL family protein N-acetyltransferase